MSAGVDGCSVTAENGENATGVLIACAVVADDATAADCGFDMVRSLQ